MAAVIIRVGSQVGASARDILTALMTAMQESGLRNLDYGDRDSLGLFQQRTSMAWGSREQITNPEYAAKAFFLGAGTNKGLLDYDSRNTMSLTQAAQTVQRSAFPDAYAKHESPAKQLLESLGDGKGVEGTLGATPGYEADMPTIGEALQNTLGDHPALNPATPEVNAAGEYTNQAVAERTSSAVGESTNPAVGERSPFMASGGIATPGMDATPGNLPLLPNLADLGVDVDMENAATGWRGEVVGLAQKFLGTPYVWGGASPGGFDCSGLLQYVFNKAGIDLPRVSNEQANAGKRISLEDMKPGDLVAWDNSSRNSGADHIAVFVGNGQIIHAPRPGASVELSNIFDRGNAWGVRISG